MTVNKTIKLFLTSTFLITAGLSLQVLADTNTKPTTSSACDFPTDATQNPDKLAWQFFVAANCGKPGSLVWETWEEQTAVYKQQTGTSTKRLHGSLLTHAKIKNNTATVSAAGNATASAVSSSDPEFRDKEACNKFSNFPTGGDYNSSSQLVCEEVHINPSAVSYIMSNGYNTRPGQQAASSALSFPASGLEVKVDWVPASDFITPFSCDAGKQPTEFYVENIDGTCYAMVGFHISSKILPNWLWATFEPQSNKTNPLRCSLYGNCKDSWGATPTTSNQQQITTQTAALQQLIKDAKLPAQFNNYILVGSQTEFLNKDGSPTLLGNSITEFSNAGVPPGEASCITCHSYSAINKVSGTDNVTNLPAYGPVGAEYVIPSGWIDRDFVWSLLLAKGVCTDTAAGKLYSNSEAKKKCPTICSAAKQTWNGQWRTKSDGKSVCGCCVE